MAPTPPLSPSSHISDLPGNHTFGQLGESDSSIASDETVHHNRVRSTRTSSPSSVGSYIAPAFRRRRNTDDNTPQRSTSSIKLTVGRCRTTPERRNSTAGESRQASFTPTIPSHRALESLTRERLTAHKLVNVVVEDEDAMSTADSSSQGHTTGIPSTLTFGAAGNGATDCTLQEIASDPAWKDVPPPFRRWISKLRRRRQQCVQTPQLSVRRERWVLDDFDRQPDLFQSVHSHHCRSKSQSSSLGFVTAVRSATATLASTSIATVSRRTIKWPRGQQRSSLPSDNDARPSIDSIRSIFDETARHRSCKRREKLEELIRTEESYLADVKALSNAYSTVLGKEGPAQKTISDMLQLHDAILGRLHEVVPFSEYDQSTARAAGTLSTRIHHARWHSVDMVPQRKTPTRNALVAIGPNRRSLNIRRPSVDDQDPSMLSCSPGIVGAVVAVFKSHVDHFAVYEEFGANYDLIQQDVEDAQRTISNWADFNKAIEALSAHVNPVRTREENRKKAMTMKDLLIKPIQRIPRYELLFGDMTRLTPVCDDPNTHAALCELLAMLNSACSRMNQAKENPVQARRLHTTWLIGQRLNFSSQVPRSIYLRMLGSVELCGCLFIAYRTRSSVRGCYVICVLFETTLLLASADEDQPKYATQAGLALANATIEEADNQKGLQCHTAPHSWKIVFEHSARMYELIFTGCSAGEAEVWRARLQNCIETQSRAVSNGQANVFELQSPLTSELKSIGKAFGKPGSFVRRMSVHRTATVGPTTDLNQVIIKNTQSMKEANDNASQTSLQIPRSQSVQTPSHVQTLQPRRIERQRLENILADVWTKELLPYPGMTRRTDPIRASANHVIRKFSMASITSNFSSSKRNASYTSIASSRKEDVAPRNSASTMSHGHSNRRGSRSVYPGRPPLVSFHNAPDAFLPSDFELQDPSAKQKKSALRTFTLTMERPFSPLFDTVSKAANPWRQNNGVGSEEDDIVPRPASVPLEKQSPSIRTVTPIYGVVDEKSKASSKPGDQAAEEARPHSGTPRKSRSRLLLRVFGQRAW